ncbi:MAG: DUF1636 domain-containing protein [Boseongicola sp.]|nr:DUF1636 domain-containing protein [Boseongicola sp.]MYH59357.1 DUF1636 domain-containing protein [Boseongicola sp. SB0675_bin_26]
MSHDQPILSFCVTCRDGHEAVHREVRGGMRLAQAFLSHSGAVQPQGFELRGVQCMSQCKRSCIVSLTASGRFSYMFGDLDAAEPGHVEALRDLIPLYLAAPEGFLRREARPEPLRARILGRLPPPGSSSDLVIFFEEMSACSVRTGMQRRGARPEKGNPALERPCPT